MIRHTVVFSLIHPEGSAKEAEFLATASSILTAVPGVKDFTVSRQVGPKSPLHFQFAMTFADRPDYDAYNAHPAHVHFVASRWVPEVSAFEEYDFVEQG